MWKTPTPWSKATTKQKDSRLYKVDQSPKPSKNMDDRRKRLHKKNLFERHYNVQHKKKVGSSALRRKERKNYRGDKIGESNRRKQKNSCGAQHGSRGPPQK